ncbi:uncharacterized protein LOC134845691 [Symsagittifera roscoffensis]|uniref:uncharacterized protein LOC134845691 n=1 Tax=Symsagittifera roscoffensis TaxID=84072 RepID=UPI00307B5621
MVAGNFSIESIGKQDSMSEQPLLFKPAVQQEVTRSLNIDYTLSTSGYESQFMTHSESVNQRERRLGGNLGYNNAGLSSSALQPKRLVKSSGRNYGSFTNTACTDSFFQHTVQQGETLQAISLKYNISIEQLKRINKLYTNEAFFLKDTILVPCPDVIPVDMTLVSQDGAHTFNDEIHSLENKQRKQNKTTSKNGIQTPRSQPVTIQATSKSNGHLLNPDADLQKGLTQNGHSTTQRGNTPPSPDISDIFKKFDTMLEVTKSNVEKLQQNSSCSAMNSSSSSESLFNLQNKTATVTRQDKKKDKKVGHNSTTSFFPESKRHDELYEL